MASIPGGVMIVTEEGRLEILDGASGERRLSHELGSGGRAAGVSGATALLLLRPQGDDVGREGGGARDLECFELPAPK